MKHLSLTIGAGLGLALLAAPASAAVLTQSDARGDVWLRESPHSYSEHGARDNVDLTASRVRHTDRAVVTSAWFTDLVRTTDSTTTVFWLRTDKGASFRVKHTVGPDDRRGTATLQRVVDGRLVARACAGLTDEVGYAENLMRVTVPRACVGRPQWVRFHGSATARELSGGATFTDAMMSADPVNDLYSARIRRG